MKQPIGGGASKILYALKTAKKMGLLNSAKALSSKNACKACALGMGGQRGGMTNELDEYPAVCNKSIQAQSSDIQAPIPNALFDFSIKELRALSAHELEHTGRLSQPVFKARGSDHYQPVEWDWALNYAAERFAATKPNRSFFYSSGRASNESGFLLQLLARVYGTNNVNNCSYYCHQATSVGMAASIGTGTATIELEDLSECDCIFVIGANPSSNHPRFIHKLKACRDRGGKVVVINPAKEPGLVKFALPKSARSLIAGGSDIASHYLQPNIGSDIALFKGIAKALLAIKAEQLHFIVQHTENFSAFKKDIDSTKWDEIVACCGITRVNIEQVAGVYANSERAVFAWGMGMTHHTFGCENIEYIANLALLRGMVGKRYSGLLPLRGHSNVQGIGTIGVKPVLAESVFTSLEQEFDITLPREAGLDTFAAMEAAHKGNIDCALINGGNLYAATPDSHWAAEALSNIDFKLFLTTTLNQGHIHGVGDDKDGGDTLILPVAARDEEPQATSQESMFNYVRLSDGGIERLQNVRSEVTILADLGQRLLPMSKVNFSRFQQFDSIREAIANTLPNMAELKDIAVAKKEFHINGRVLHTPKFNTASKRARFQVHAIPCANRQREDYPFLLASVRSEGQFNSIIYEETDSYRFDAGRHAVFMCAQDITTLDLKSGDNVDLKSPNGRMNNAVVQEFDLPAGNLLAYFPEANALAERRLDPRSRTPNFKSIPIQIIKK